MPFKTYSETVSGAKTNNAAHSADHMRDWLTDLRKGQSALEGIWRRRVSENSTLCDEGRSLVQSTTKHGFLTDLVECLPGDKNAYDRARNLIVNQVRRLNYSISDLFIDTTCLCDAIGEWLESFDDDILPNADTAEHMLRDIVRRLFNDVLDQTSVVYEDAFEEGMRGYCQFKLGGQISFANAQMVRLLGTSAAVGQTLQEFFEGRDAEFVHQAVTGQLTRPGIRRLHLHRNGGEPIRVDAEIALTSLNFKDLTGYATFTDISSFDDREKRLFEQANFGVVRVDDELGVRYVNKVARRIVGARQNETLEGRSLTEVVSPEDLAKIRQRIDNRKRGMSEEYTFALTQLHSAQSRQIRTLAIAEEDDHGVVIGSLGLIRDVTVDTIAQNLHRHIAQTKDPEELHELAAKELESLIDFDMVTVSINSTDLEHARVLHTYPDAAQTGLEWMTRWYKLSDRLKQFAASPEIAPVDDLKKFLIEYDAPELLDEPSVKALIEWGVKSFLRYPIEMNNKIVGSINFLSKTEGRYNDSQVRDLRQLPLNQVGRTILHERRHRHDALRLKLYRALCEATSLSEVAHILVDHFADHYQWEHVSLFLVDERDRQFRLLAQSSGTDTKIKLPKKFKVPFGEGLLGAVYQSGEPKYCGDLDNDALGELVRKIHPEVHSEACFPFVFGERVRWLLNVEDRSLFAFCNDDLSEIEEILESTKSFVENIFHREFMFTAIKQSYDPLFITEQDGTIILANEQAEFLLETRGQSLVGRTIQEFVRDEPQQKRILDGRRIRNDEVTFVTCTGEEKLVLLSGVGLLKSFGRMGYSAKDLSDLKRVEELEAIGELSKEISLQTGAPLSLAFSWLNKLKQDLPDDSTASVIEKTVWQLRKIQMTNTKLALYDTQMLSGEFRPTQLSLNATVEDVLRDFPENELAKINHRKINDVPNIRGDAFELEFTLRAILSHLLRYAPINGRIEVDTVHRDGNVELTVSGTLPATDAAKTNGEGRRPGSFDRRRNISLGEPVIRKFIEAHHQGAYRVSNTEDGQTRFSLSFPIDVEIAS